MIEVAKEKPAKGKRILAYNNNLAIGAVLMNYLNEKDLFWRTDLKTDMPFESFTHWQEVPLTNQ